MKLFEAILEANHLATASGTLADVQIGEFPDSLPVIALTCIDARLNRLIPEALGVSEERFIWLRNAGNVIFEPMSSMTRTLAMACAVKGGKEIAVIGHTDCLVFKTSVLQLMERFRELGVERSRLPDNLVEFFGLTASERQNVIKACDIIRRSPLIGPGIPVHGLLMDINVGKLEWLVNGYESFATSDSPAVEIQSASAQPIGAIQALAAQTPVRGAAPSDPLPSETALSLDPLPVSGTKIGEMASDMKEVASTAEKLLGEIKRRSLMGAWESGKELLAEVKETVSDAKAAVGEAQGILESLKAMPPAERMAALGSALDPARRYTILGADQKKYGPISGKRLWEWILEDRITEQTPIQVQGSTVWRTLGSLLEASKRSK